MDKDGYLQGGEIPEQIRVVLAQAMARADTRISLRQYLEYREAAYQLQVASSFKHRDRNEDGVLQLHEMPDELLNSLTTYARSKVGVTFAEYLKFRRDRDFPVPRPSPPHQELPVLKSVPRTVKRVIDNTELEKRPIVYRAGKLPPGLPEWFERLDLDQDGQISLYEWRRGDKPLEEFDRWDHNDDGLVTFDEVLRKLKRDGAPGH